MDMRTLFSSFSFGKTFAGCLSFFLAMFCVFVASAEVSETIFVGARTDTPPMSYKDKDGEFRGYTIDICNLIFKHYNQTYASESPVKFVFKEVSASTRFTLLEKGEISAVCGATTITNKRMAKFNFSFFIFVSGASVMAWPQTPDPFSTKSKKKSDEPVRVAVVSGTTTETKVKNLLGTSVHLSRMADHPSAIKALLKNEVDYYLGDKIILEYVLRQHDPQKRLIVGPRFLSYEPYAIPVSVENRNLLLAANETISHLYRSRKIRDLYRAHFPDSKLSKTLRQMYRIFRVPEE